MVSNNVFESFYLNIKLEDEDAKLPVRAHSSDAGMDVFATKDYTIEPRSDCLMPLGWSCEFPDGYSLIVKEKSGRAVKNKLDVGACIDGNTKIVTDAGMLKAKDITNKRRLLTYNKNLNIYIFKKCDGFRVTGTKKTLKLTFMNGRTLVCSEDHKLFTVNFDWVTAKDLKDQSLITAEGITELKFKEFDGIKEVYSTNVEDNHNYISAGGFINHNCVIDSSYRGIVHVHLFNNSDKTVHIKKHEKIAQMIVVPVWCGSPKKVETLDINTDRATGGFGSTGLK